jgi:hypothetical protein
MSVEKIIVSGENFKAILRSPTYASWSAYRDPGPIAELLRYYGIQRAFVPDTDFSGLIARGNEEPIILYQEGGVTLETAKSREGTFIDRGEAVVVCTGGCPVVIATDKRRILCVAHAGRDSLVDREKILSKQASREDEGVIDQMARSLREIGVDPGMMELHGYFGIHREIFAHDLSDERNQMMHEYINERWPRSSITKPGFACIDLGALIFQQGIKAGFGSVKYGSVIPVDETEFPTTRSPGGRGSFRNLAIVINREAPVFLDN